jgi:hypothetical protein
MPPPVVDTEQPVSMNMVVFPLLKHDQEFAGASSNDYYLVLNATHTITIKGCRFSFADPSSDSVRWALYRGDSSSAQRVAQTDILSGVGASKGITEMFFNDHPSFEKDEKFILAFAVSGGDTTLKGASTAALDTQLSWYNIEDSVAGGFPSNPRPRESGGALREIPCVELISV